jgi:L-fucose mutarotase
MLKGTLLHPQILAALARAGHRSQVLISDGNYPHATKTNRHAELVFLNLAPGLVSVTQVVEALLGVVPIETAHVMRRDDGGSVPVWTEFERLLPGVPLLPLGLFEFYAAAQSPDVCLVIATGEQRQWANLLLTIGVVPPPPL